MNIQKYTAILGMLAAGSFGGNDPGFGAGLSGQVYCANEASIHDALRLGREFTAANDGNLDVTPMGLSQAMTDYIAGVPDEEGLDALLEQIAPATPVGSIMFHYLQEVESMNRQTRTLDSIERPTGGVFPELPVLQGTQANGACANIGLVSYLDINQGAMLPQMQQAEVKRLRSIIRRSQIADALAKIDAAAVGDTDANWGASTSDPDSDVEEMCDTSATLSGIDPSTVIFGHGGIRKRKKAYRQPARNNGGELARLSTDELAQELNVERVVHVKSTYRTSATAAARQLDSKVYVLDARKGLGPKNSSNIKRFQYVTVGGGMRVWIEVQSHRVKFTVDAFETTEITRATGIRKRTLTYTT
ncbi:MAG: hypothetical protein ACO1TE_29160 [Prosthecobacter sp.]